MSEKTKTFDDPQKYTQSSETLILTIINTSFPHTFFLIYIVIQAINFIHKKSQPVSQKQAREEVPNLNVAQGKLLNFYIHKSCEIPIS